MSEPAGVYLIALGGNVRHHRHGPPEKVLVAAFDRLDEVSLTVLARSRIMRSDPLGPSRRRYANAAALVESDLPPPDMLSCLKKIEVEFGRKTGGARWSARVLDLDIVMWSGGIWGDARLTIPHPSFRTRDFVLSPANEIAPDMRDPVSGRSIRQLLRTLMSQGA